MFTIIGGDGKEYGPASAAQIRTWIAAGRANLETQARAEGSSEWRPLGEYPEFATPEAPPVLEASEAELAGRGTRLLAKLTDEVCSLICALPGMTMIGFSSLQAILQSARGAPAEDLDLSRNLTGVSVMLLGLLILAVIQIWMISTRGQSIGKRVFGIRIVRIADNGLPGFVQGWLLRSLVPGFIALLPFGIGFGFSVVDVCFIFRRDRRCIHDFIAGTHVVKA